MFEELLNSPDEPEIEQLESGYKASIDSFILSTAIEPKDGDTILDVGSGVGTVSALAAYGIPNVHVTAIELDQEAAVLAEKNYRNRGILADVHCADFADFDFLGVRFDYVITNPPYYQKGSGKVSPSSKKYANQETMPLDSWVKLCLKRVKPKGTFAMIHLAERLGDILKAIDESCWGIVVTPISFEEEEPAKRILITARNGSKKKLVLDYTHYA